MNPGRSESQRLANDAERAARATFDRLLDAVRGRDHETAHMLEKGLLAQATILCAEGKPGARAVARIALEASKLDFRRWFA